MTSATGVRPATGTRSGPLRVGRGPQADRQPEPPLLGRVAVDLGHQAHRADRDRRGPDRRAVRAPQQLGRRQHPVVVQEWLAHPHEHRAGDPPPLRADQLPACTSWSIISHVSRLRRLRHPRRCAEDAAHRAADLRREADAHRPRLVQRDQHRLHRQAVGRPEEELLEPVDLGRGQPARASAAAADRGSPPAVAAGPGNARPRRRDHGCRGRRPPRAGGGSRGPGHPVPRARASKAGGVMSRGSSTDGLPPKMPESPSTSSARFLKVFWRQPGRRRGLAGCRSGAGLPCSDSVRSTRSVEAGPHGHRRGSWEKPKNWTQPSEYPERSNEVHLGGPR